MDRSFGNNGKVVFSNIGGGGKEDEKVTLWLAYVWISYTASELKIYLAGSTLNKSGNYCLYVIRLNSDGSIDHSFGNAGKLLIDMAHGFVNKFFIDNINNKIYFGGANYDDYLYLLRLTKNGSIDKIYLTGECFYKLQSNELQTDVYIIQLK